jgi:gamma-glutamyltranspeptidase/glutathione hydrolase
MATLPARERAIEPAEPVRIPSVPALGRRGAVVAPHHLATAAGLRILAAGGHAIDAAIATNAVLAVVTPNGCGIGGDAFWLVWDEAAGEQLALNGSGRAPAAANAAALRDRGLTRLPLRGPLGISTPGVVRSWGDVHRRWGRLSLSEVLAPAIELAGDGFPAWDGLRRAVDVTAAGIGDAPWAAGFHAVWRPHGRPWAPGEVIRLPALAATLQRIADDGPDALYDGELGARQASFLAGVGAPFAVEDFSGHRSDWTSPIATTYRGTRVTTHPPNSCGIVALEILNILETFDPPAAETWGPDGWADPRWIHLGIEASKLGLADRDAHVCDPSGRDDPVAILLDKERARDLARRIREDRADLTPTACRTLVGGTIYLATVDAEGDAVSLIQSNAAGFGSGVVDPQTGIHYQNRGSSFSLEAGHPNELAGGRRTTHSLLPGMLFRDGERSPWIVVGSMGGDIQPQIHAQFVSAVVDGRADVATAVGAPRWLVEPEGHFARPIYVGLESRIAPDAATDLRARGHDVHIRPAFDGGFGHEHAIELVRGGPAAEDGSLAAATDPRSAGLPAVR